MTYLSGIKLGRVEGGDVQSLSRCFLRRELSGIGAT